MEPIAAALLFVNIFSQCNVQLGFFIGDNDSSAINAARNLNHEIIKQDNLNHTGKGVVYELYKNIKCSKELNAKSIKYFDRNFKYCIQWCWYLKDPDS